MHTHNKFYFKHKFDCALHGALLILFFLQRLGDFVLAHINHSFFFLMEIKLHTGRVTYMS